MYSYFEKGRTKCTRQSRKALREILSSLFCSFWKNGTSDRGRMFASAKGKKQSRFDSYSPETVCCLYPIIPFRIVAYTLFPTNFLEIAVYLCRPDPTRTKNDHIWKSNAINFTSSVWVQTWPPHLWTSLISQLSNDWTKCGYVMMAKKFESMSSLFFSGVFTGVTAVVS